MVTKVAKTLFWIICIQHKCMEKSELFMNFEKIINRTSSKFEEKNCD